MADMTPFAQGYIKLQFVMSFLEDLYINFCMFLLSTSELNVSVTLNQVIVCAML